MEKGNKETGRMLEKHSTNKKLSDLFLFLFPSEFFSPNAQGRHSPWGGVGHHSDQPQVLELMQGEEGISMIEKL